VRRAPFNDLSGILPAIGGFVLNVSACLGVADRALIPEPLQLLRTRLGASVRRYADEHRPPRPETHHRLPSFQNREQLDVSVPLRGRKFSRKFDGIVIVQPKTALEPTASIALAQGRF